MTKLTVILLMLGFLVASAQAEMWWEISVLADSENGTEYEGVMYADQGEVSVYLVYNGIGGSGPSNIAYNTESGTLVAWDGSNIGSVSALNIVEHDTTNAEDWFYGNFRRLISDVYLHSWGETSPSWDAMNERSFTIIAVSDVDGDYSTGARYGIFTGTPSGFTDAHGNSSIANLATEYLDASGQGLLNVINTDQDGDGIPDAWEIGYFASIENCNPTDDPDGDLYTNIEEYQNNTDPTQFGSYLLQKRVTALELYYKAATGAVYQVQMSTNFTSGVWYDIGSPVVGDGQMHYMLESTSSSEYGSYRIVITDQP